ncbi:MAG: glyceraldehyde 3-phosphate dehydrogenase NAD-binding domain-containing protein [Bacteroidales bacterium]|nr:glyceraldehyde 3-phosphate dehydrogenase NAD-binding domain-containing protein [Bacteroidales bacterium]
MEATDHELVVNGKSVKILSQPDPSKLPWKDLGIDIVLESTGKFVEKEQALRHVHDSGARKVITLLPPRPTRMK